MPELIVRSGKHEGKKLVLPNSDVTIGRDEECQIRFATNDVSRKHCILQMTPQGMNLRDLGSRNGTLVNDVRVESEQLLSPGDMIRIGPILLEVPGVKRTEPAAPSLPDAEPSIHAATADEIASWLMEDEDDEFSSSDTTTIMKDKAGTGGEATSKAEAKSDHAIPKSDPNKKKFKSTAQEAAHIISSWNELVALEDG